MRIFISGANRGIGLALARYFAERGDMVFGTARQPEQATDLQATPGVSVLPLDVTDNASIDAAASHVQAHTQALDVVINNAGLMKSPGGLNEMDLDDSLRLMHVNAIAPVFVAKAFLPLLRAGDKPKLVNITSQLGSLSRKTSGGRYDYCASKAALNMYTRALAADFAPMGITTVMVHPGWVQTDMGGGSASLSPEESAAGIVKLVDDLGPDDNGGFFRWDGSTHPW